MSRDEAGGCPFLSTFLRRRAPQSGHFELALIDVSKTGCKEEGREGGVSLPDWKDRLDLDVLSLSESTLPT